MKIKNIHLQNFRGFIDLEISFPDENIVVLIGKNGAGKSSVIDAVTKLLSEMILVN